MSKWEPIETAPKDGRTFIAYGIDPRGGFEYGKGVGVCWWGVGPDGGRWEGSPAYPTHWMSELELPE